MKNRVPTGDAGVGHRGIAIAGNNWEGDPEAADVAGTPRRPEKKATQITKPG